MEIKTGLGKLPISRNGKVIIPRGIREIPDKLTKIKLPYTLVEIGDCAFLDCPAIKHIDIPESVRAIDKRAFE